MLVKIRKKRPDAILLTRRSMVDAGFKSTARTYVRKPTLTELHRRLRQVVNYTESSLRVNRMRTKTNGLFEECHADLEWNSCRCYSVDCRTT